MTEFLINSQPTLSQCNRCTGWIYRCHINGFETKVEPTPLNLSQELELRIQGRRIFQTFGMTLPILVPRTLAHIEQASPGIKILANHSCQSPTYFEPEPLFETLTIPTTDGVPF